MKIVTLVPTAQPSQSDCVSPAATEGAKNNQSAPSRTNVNKYGEAFLAGEVHPGPSGDVILRLAMAEVTHSRVDRHSPPEWGFRAWLSPKDHGDPQRRYVFAD
jgi:hypothetical protein